jgi:hypothetical protein
MNKLPVSSQEIYMRVLITITLEVIEAADIVSLL